MKRRFFARNRRVLVKSKKDRHKYAASVVKQTKNDITVRYENDIYKTYVWSEVYMEPQMDADGNYSDNFSEYECENDQQEFHDANYDTDDSGSEAEEVWGDDSSQNSMIDLEEEETVDDDAEKMSEDAEAMFAEAMNAMKDAETMELSTIPSTYELLSKNYIQKRKCPAFQFWEVLHDPVKYKWVLKAVTNENTNNASLDLFRRFAKLYHPDLWKINLESVFQVTCARVELQKSVEIANQKADVELADAKMYHDLTNSCIKTRSGFAVKFGQILQNVKEYQWILKLVTNDETIEHPSISLYYEFAKTYHPELWKMFPQDQTDTSTSTT